MAQRFYNEVRELKDENTRLSGRAKRAELKPSTIVKGDRDYQTTKKKTSERKSLTKSKLPITQTILLKCLVRPEAPLHNNQNESDIRKYVKRREISGFTKNDDGRKAIDTSLSLKKTCQRHDISFMEFLNDRLQNIKKIPVSSNFIQKISLIPAVPIY
jgi:hypothetical protein